MSPRATGRLALALTLLAGRAAWTTEERDEPPPDVAAPPADAARCASGLATKILAVGRGTEHAGDNDCVRLDYRAWRGDGTLVSSTQLEGAPSRQCLLAMTPALAGAVKEMTVGERRRVWLPAALTAVHGGDADEARPGVDLVYELDLVEILHAPPVPGDLRAPPGTARRSEGGVAMVLLEKGQGDVPSAASRLKLHFSGWTSDGRLIESTRMAGQPAVYTLADAPPGWRDALEQMVVGDVARLWIPAERAYGATPRRRGQPAGDLVYEIELLALE